MSLETQRAIPIPETKAKAQIVGKDGNAFAVMGRALLGMKHAGYSAELREQYQRECLSGDYDHMLAVTLDYVEDSGDDYSDIDMDSEELYGYNPDDDDYDTVG